MGNQFDVAAGARLESTGRAPSNDEIVPRFSLDDINQAFDNNEFCFYLQPKCNAETGAIVGAEALVRWNHPEYGLVSPGEFIPLLERESMVTRFDLFIWRSVCEMLSRWDGEGRNLVPVSVNVSMTDIEAIDVARVLGDLLDRSASMLACCRWRSQKVRSHITWMWSKRPFGTCMREALPC